MSEKYLTLEQNMCAARIFLNTFGLTLENVSDVNEFSKVKIFDGETNVVGKLHFDNGKVIMNANYNNSILQASYDIAKMRGFVDIESNNALFGQWSSKINFQVQKQDNVKLSGEFFVGSSADSEFGVSCLCHPLINCDVPEKGKITLKILRDGRTFGLEIAAGSYNETIDIMPWDFICHDVKNGKYDEEKHSFPYRRYAGVFDGSYGMNNDNPLHVFLKESEYSNLVTYRDEKVPKVSKNDSRKISVQKGMLMKDLDPDMFEKIKKLRKVLSIGDISLLDNLVSVCYDSYTDAELSSLLGVNRQRMNYQDGADNLVNSYYGIGSDSCFLSLNQQKRLLHK